MDSTIDDIITRALKEDLPKGDITSQALFTTQQSEAFFLAKATGTVSGIAVAKRVFELVDNTLYFKPIQHDGEDVESGDLIAIVQGKTASILAAERTALNIMQRMSGISTATKRYVNAIKGTNAAIMDTRKTVPNLRVLDKLAVSLGGGVNHRMSLSDQVLIKDNHIHAAEGITNAVETVRQATNPEMLIEVEVETFEQFEEALNTSANIVMLDNMSTDLMRQCVERNQHFKKLEASGNITLSTVRAVAETGVDYISIGALTHSVTAFDISLKFQHERRES
jgi:nicotinate-nucleotide pyrophosphorylase (carboxylating)